MPGTETAWITLITSVVPPTMVAIWTVVQWLATRKDKKQETQKSYAERREADMDRDRKEVLENQAMVVRELREDIIECRKQLHEKNIDRNHAWERARFWHQRAWDMRNEAAYARQLVESTERLANQPVRIWHNNIDMAPFDENPNPPTPSRQGA